jgi:hypothetical protein
VLTFLGKKLLPSVVTYAVKYVCPIDAHVCLSWCVLFSFVLCCAAKSSRCVCVFELVDCVLFCCVLCREVPSMLMCVREGGLCSLLFYVVPRSPHDAYVCLSWWVVFSFVVCCAASPLDAHVCLSWWVVFSLVWCSA